MVRHPTLGWGEARHEQGLKSLWQQLRLGTPEGELNLEEFPEFESLKNQHLHLEQEV